MATITNTATGNTIEMTDEEAGAYKAFDVLLDAGYSCVEAANRLVPIHPDLDPKFWIWLLH